MIKPVELGTIKVGERFSPKGKFMAHIFVRFEEFVVDGCRYNAKNQDKNHYFDLKTMVIPIFLSPGAENINPDEARRRIEAEGFDVHVI